MARNSSNQNASIQQNISKFLTTILQLSKALWRQILALYRQLFWQPSNWLIYADKQCQLGDLEGAIASCNQAIKRNSGDSSAWYKKGHIVSELQHNEEAVSCFDKALKIAPESHTIWCERASILIRLQRHKEAIDSYTKALKIKPNIYSAWVNKGDLLFAQQPRAAADCYEQALKLQPKNAEVTQKLNTLLVQLQDEVENLLKQANNFISAGDLSSAVKICEQAVGLRPDFEQGWYIRGKVLEGLQRYQEAITSYEKALNLKPSHHLAIFAKGNALCRLQRYQEALDSYNQALKLKPDAPEIIRKRELATQELQKIEEYAEDLLQTGMNQHESGKYEEAVKYYDQALELISKNLVSTR